MNRAAVRFGVALSTALVFSPGTVPAAPVGPGHHESGVPEDMDQRSVGATSRLDSLTLIGQLGGEISDLRFHEGRLFATVGPRLVVLEPSETEKLRVVAESPPYTSALSRLAILPDGTILTTGVDGPAAKLLRYSLIDDLLVLSDSLELPSEAFALAAQLLDVRDGSGAYQGRLLVAVQSGVITLPLPLGASLAGTEARLVPLPETTVDVVAEGERAFVLTTNVRLRSGTIWSIGDVSATPLVPIESNSDHAAIHAVRLALDGRRVYATGTDVVIEASEAGRPHILQLPYTLPVGVLRDGVLYTQARDGSVLAVDPHDDQLVELAESKWPGEIGARTTWAAPIAASDGLVAIAVDIGLAQIMVGDIGHVERGEGAVIPLVGHWATLPVINDVDVQGEIFVAGNGELWQLPPSASLALTPIATRSFVVPGYFGFVGVSTSHVLGLEANASPAFGTAFAREEEAVPGQFSFGPLPLVRSLDVEGLHAYVTSYSAVHVLQLDRVEGDPLIQNIAPGGDYNPFDADVNGSLLAIARDESVEIWRRWADGRASGLSEYPVAGRRVTAQYPLVAVSNDEGITILDVADLRAPRQASFLPWPDVQDLVLAGTSLFVIDEQGIVEVDLSNPRSPVPRKEARISGDFPRTPGNFVIIDRLRLATDRNVLAVSAGAAGLWIFDIGATHQTWLPWAAGRMLLEENEPENQQGATTARITVARSGD